MSGWQYTLMVWNGQSGKLSKSYRLASIPAQSPATEPLPAWDRWALATLNAIAAPWRAAGWKAHVTTTPE